MRTLKLSLLLVLAITQVSAFARVRAAATLLSGFVGFTSVWYTNSRFSPSYLGDRFTYVASLPTYIPMGSDTLKAPSKERAVRLDDRLNGAMPRFHFNYYEPLSWQDIHLRAARRAYAEKYWGGNVYGYNPSQPHFLFGR